MTQLAVEEAAFLSLENQEANERLELKRAEAERLEAELAANATTSRLEAMIARATGRGR